MSEPAKRKPDFREHNDPDMQIYSQVTQRLNGLRNERYSWWEHWRDLADFLLPRRYKWIVTPNQAYRGSPINQHILDSTGTMAARNLAAGLFSGVSSPTKPWIKLRCGYEDDTKTTPTSLWLSECKRILMLVFAESNFYTSIAIWYFDAVVFGTASMLIYEDYEDVIRCYNPALGEFFLENSARLANDVHYREFVYTVAQCVEEFGFANCSQSVQSSYENGGANLGREIRIGHAIEPNTDGRKFGIPDHFKYREVYWEQGQTHKAILRKRGFFEKPHIALLWDTTSNDSYGRAPGMDALPDVKQLQQETRRKAQAIDKHVNPPMLADIQLKNQPASMLPGGVTYIAGLMSQSKPGFTPTYTVQPVLNYMMEDIKEVQARIKEVFFNHLFQVISQYETRSNISATEIDARRAESLVMLGPVLNRIENALGEIVARVFSIAARNGVLPPPPPEVSNNSINIEFVSMLATAQRAAASSGIERLFAFSGNLAAVDPSAMDNIDIDFAIERYSALLDNDPQLIRPAEMLEAIRANRMKQQQKAQQMAQVQQGADAAKVLSETDVGGGQNALQKMTGVVP